MVATAMAPDLGHLDYGGSWRPHLERTGARIFRARPRRSLLEWAEAERRWLDGSAYRVSETPHLREPMEAYSDPGIEEITIKKITQSGFTDGLVVNAAGYHIDHDPRAILVVIPSVDEAEKWSKKKLQPMIDSTPRLYGRLEEGSRKHSNTMLEKGFPGGSLGIVGSNSGRGFRMVTSAVVFGDDVNGWDQTAGKGAESEGDQVVLIRRRTDRIPDRKLVWISTPTRRTGRISRRYEAMERRGEFHVPCLQCGEMQVLLWKGLKWESEEVDLDYVPAVGEIIRGATLHRPNTAYYECQANGCRIDEDDKPAMAAAGDYLAEDGQPVRQPGVRSVGYWLRGALSITLPGSEWPKLIREFLDVKDTPAEFMAFVNLVLGEEWKDGGTAPNWQRLYDRRESYEMGICPSGVEFITVGADVQETWAEAYVWGWGWDKESWLIEHIVVDGKFSEKNTRDHFTALIHRAFRCEDDRDLPVAAFAIDTQHDKASVMSWASEVGDPRVMPIRGDHWKNWVVILGTPTKTDITFRGKRVGLLLWPVGGALIKQETYGFFGLDSPEDGQPFPAGWVHLPRVDSEMCKQLVAEDLVEDKDKDGYPRRSWQKNRHRNEALDCFDAETDVLTDAGWKRFAQVARTDMLATVNLKTREVEFEAPTHLIARHYTGDMIQLKSRTVDILVTPEHRMVTFKKTFGRQVRRWDFDVPPAITLAKDLTVHHALMRATAGWRGCDAQTVTIPASISAQGRQIEPDRVVDAEDWAAFLGWYVSEGCCFEGRCESQRSVRRRVQLDQREGEKADAIRSLISRLPWRFHEAAVRGTRRWIATSKQLYHAVQSCGVGVENKRVPGFVRNASQRIIRRFIESAIAGDGWTQQRGKNQREHRSYATVSAQLADDMQELFVKIGRSANMRSLPAARWNIEGRSGTTRPQFHVSELKTDRAYLDGGTGGRRGYLGRTIQYDGMVFCATVPNGTLVCRRAGKTFVAGNCRVYARAAAERLGLGRMTGPRPEPKPRPKQQSDESSPEPKRSGGWLESRRNRGRWL